MNKWVKGSIKLARSRGYLDNLMDIYPVNLTLTRDISALDKEKIKRAFKKRKTKDLISILLTLERFPIDDPYIGFLRKDKEALNKNPKTVRRIGQRLLKMGLDEILLGASRAKAPSRQVGQMFRSWLYKLRYPIFSKAAFLKSNKTAILEGGDASLMSFAKKELGYRGQKGLDLVLRTKDKFIIGEAKFITTSGGTQDKSFRESISFIKHKEKNIIRIAIMDGVVWLVSGEAISGKKKLSLYETVVNLRKNEVALSALLLERFIKEQ
jgi:hypothetical protein